ncbi:MAG: hypothetical protein RX318_09445 [bacterium]|nr:hypothetical protein [bacterium]
MRGIDIGLVLALIVTTAAGCASVQRLEMVKHGMSKQDVYKNLGPPIAVKANITNRHGQAIEVWEYKLALPDSPDTETFKVVTAALTFGAAAPVWLAQNTKLFWLTFVNERLSQWQEATDEWPAEEKRIFETKMPEIPCCL